MNADQFELMQKIQTSPAAPPKIYNWLNSQMSIARYYGGLKYMGHHYYVAPDEEGAPLVRADVFEAEAKAKKLADKSEKLKAAETKKQKAAEAQGNLP
jgi:hypothetical protein